MLGSIVSSTEIRKRYFPNNNDGGVSNYMDHYWNIYFRKLYSLLSEYTDHCIPLIYTGHVPDFLIRWGIRIRLRSHLKELSCGNDVEQQLIAKQKIVAELYEMPIAIETVAANQQHYEVPTKFYDLCLGPCKKYSSGYWKKSFTTFAQSELDMLELYCERIGIIDGMKIVDLGCGWGSFTLYVIEKYPNCIITSISNSQSQREYIYKTAAARQLNIQNINVITCNVADDKGALEIVKDNDIVVTVEMFEHMKNYDHLLSKVSKFLKPKTGLLFVHIFTHKDYCYHFDGGWMSDNFFSGGIMPSDDLLLYFPKYFMIQKHWRVPGIHYAQTSNAWLATLDNNWNNGLLFPVLSEIYGNGKEQEWYINWRLFFLACAELWGLDNGQEYIVSHYLFQVRQSN